MNITGLARVPERHIYVSDFGSVTIPPDVHDQLEAMTDIEQNAWERQLKQHCADVFAAGGRVGDIVPTI